jgi:hypothetical protein
MLQEVEEARRLYISQKRALKDALSAAAEREAAETAAGESGLEAATAAAEEEVERLVQVRIATHRHEHTDGITRAVAIAVCGAQRVRGLVGAIVGGGGALAQVRT